MDVGVTTQFPSSVLPASVLIFSSALLLTVPQSHATHREAGGHHAHHRAMWLVPQGTPQGPGKAAARIGRGASQSPSGHVQRAERPGVEAGDTDVFVEM